MAMLGSGQHERVSGPGAAEDEQFVGGIFIRVFRLAAVIDQGGRGDSFS